MTQPVVIGNATPKVTAIYALCEWPSLSPRYVGKTTQYIIDRRKAHIRAAMRGGRLPVRERDWIARCRAEGCQLLNLTDGGEGLSGHVFTQQHRERIAASLRAGSTFACIRCGREFWRKPNQIRRGHNKFCGRKCANASQQEARRAAA